jgi:hypothetical protein
MERESLRVVRDGLLRLKFDAVRHQRCTGSGRGKDEQL